MMRIREGSGAGMLLKFENFSDIFMIYLRFSL